MGVDVEWEEGSLDGNAEPSMPKMSMDMTSTHDEWEEGDLDRQDSGETQALTEQTEPDESEGTGPFETLAGSGPRDSAGSGGHPDGCTPCTFYCFARRGCNRSAECRFCHLAHQSKLQLRREAWKQQQRQKRKAMNEAMALEAAARRREAARMQAPDFKRGMGMSGLRDGFRAMPITLFDQLVGENPRPGSGYGAQSAPAGRGQMPVPSADILATNPAFGGGGTFSYSPPRAVLALGQKTDFRPQLTDLGGVPAQFRPANVLPPGFTLDPASGVLYAEPAQHLPLTTIVIEADMLGGRTLRSSVEIEIIDFSRGGFHIGHLSEFEPGRFMVLLCRPDDAEDDIQLPVTQCIIPGHENGREDQGHGGRRPHTQGRRLPSLPEVEEELPARGRPSRRGPGGAHPPAVNAADVDDEGMMGTVLKLAQALDDPLLGTAAMPTVGSAGHNLNKCSPCAFVYKEGCASGAACRFCHLCERGEKRRRKKELKGFQRMMIPA